MKCPALFFILGIWYFTTNPRLSENNTTFPGSKTRRLKEEHLGGFYPGFFDFEANRTFSDSLLLAGIQEVDSRFRGNDKPFGHQH